MSLQAHMKGCQAGRHLREAWLVMSASFVVFGTLQWYKGLLTIASYQRFQHGQAIEAVGLCDCTRWYISSQSCKDCVATLSAQIRIFCFYISVLVVQWHLSMAGRPVA